MQSELSSISEKRRTPSAKAMSRAGIAHARISGAGEAFASFDLGTSDGKVGLVLTVAGLRVSGSANWKLFGLTKKGMRNAFSLLMCKLGYCVVFAGLALMI